MRTIVIMVALTTIAGCAGPTLGPAGGRLEATTQSQVTCSAKGLRPGTDAFNACLGDRERSTGPAEKATGAPTATADCKLSPLGGYICTHRPK
jgi:hypothetical protein